ncbi:MAG TPA: hypothetical protein VFA19_06720 [Gaiellaceae bacterium]|nr:hypothetical protein [Gaiellaceae bacterium]
MPAVAALVLSACGSRSSAGTTTSASPPADGAAVCRTLSAAAVDSAKALLRAYTGVVSPGDVAFYDLREALGYAQRHRCRPAALGGALARGLTPTQLAGLLSNLPGSYVRYLRQATACFRGDLPDGRCVSPAGVIEPPGAGKPSGTSHPLTP